MQALPDCCEMFWPIVFPRGEHGRIEVAKDWRKDPAVQSYLKKKGYVLRRGGNGGADGKEK